MEQLLIAHKPALIALTDALQNKQILTINQITKIIEQIEGKGLKQMQSILDPHTAPEKSAMSPNLNEDIVSNTDDADQEDDEEAEPAVI